MTDKIKSQLTNAYMMFIIDFADPSSVDRHAIESEMKCVLVDVFSSQKMCDRAKRLLKVNFNKMLSIYFNQFNGRDGLDFQALDSELSKNKKHLLRHLGKDKLAYLHLVISLMKALDERKVKKGLLAS